MYILTILLPNTKKRYKLLNLNADYTPEGTNLLPNYD